MKHVKLFESWKKDDMSPAEVIAEYMIMMAGKDPEMSEYKLELDSEDPKIIMVIWTNPGESERWKESGYADDYENPEEAKPMCSLAILEIGGEIFAYTLTPEEKYYKSIVTSEDEEGNEEYDEDQIVPLVEYDDFKRALLTSIWEME